MSIVMIMSCYFPPRVAMEITRMLTLLRLCMEGALSDYGMSGAYECLCAYLTKRYRAYLSSTYHCGPAALVNSEDSQIVFTGLFDWALGCSNEIQKEAVTPRDPFLEACGVTAFDIGTNYRGIVDLDVMSPQNGICYTAIMNFRPGALKVSLSPIRAYYYHLKGLRNVDYTYHTT
ncbi:hypothetical protein Cgig2_013200 [Carnegiea gigantea]|uniref:Uncharacterized protein n=1 Tax=Carnegiea gigantea TaxID=171969 RepID=A0A9Q1KNQ7_9CARY|nr:hypothetical protein Cgig2_013200 [Carnegiea gigantea]